MQTLVHLFDYNAGVTWLPRIREAGWLKTGKDGPEGSHRYADRHLFVRLQQDMNGTGEWTLELHDCHRAAGGHVARVYDNESDARAALACIYALTRYLEPLTEVGRWEIKTYELSDGDQRQLARFT